MSYLLGPVPISLLASAKTCSQQKKGQNVTSLMPKCTVQELNLHRTVIDEQVRNLSRAELLSRPLAQAAWLNWCV
jgi:hypothetical protein